MPVQVGIYIFDNVEVLDFAGPYEVFTCASRCIGENRHCLMFLR
jgi:putative intracellular protease/amidase